MIDVNDKWSALAIVASGLGSAVVAQLGILLRARNRAYRGLDRANVTAADRANARLSEVLERRIDELRDELDQTRRDLRETKESLDDKNEAWMVASRAHEDCERRLDDVERRLRKLDGREAE
jgi:chromosome segregation ATPase